MTEKGENFGCLSKSLKDFLYMDEDKRKKKYGNDIYKYYQRAIKNVEYSFSDIMLAYEHLPDEQKSKINLFVHIESLLSFIQEKNLAKTPDELISTTRTGLYALLKGRIANDEKIKELASSDFEKAIKWLGYLAPENPMMKDPIS